MTSAGCIARGDTNITPRPKRQRKGTSSPKSSAHSSSESSDLRADVLKMLSEWKEDQERNLCEWKSTLNDTLSKLFSELSHLKTEFQEIKKSNSEIEKGIEFINKIQEETNCRLKEIECNQKNNKNAIKNLESRIQDIQFRTRDSSLEIRNIPISENEKFDNLLSTLSVIGKAVDIDINRSDVRDLYRLPGKPGVSRPVVVEFTRVHARNDLLTKLRNFNKERPVPEKLNTHTIGLPGIKTPLYIDEHLGPSQRKLMFETRQFAKKHSYSCWHSNGRILLRKDSTGKPILIQSEKCLSELAKES